MQLVTKILAGLLFAMVPCLVAAEDMIWREVDPKNLVFMELPDGMVTIEITDRFAPKTAKQFRELVGERFYDGLGFYRVIDGFVAQGGDGSDLGELSDKPTIEAEFELEWDEALPWTLVQAPEMFAPETGFIDGFAAARDPQAGTVWLTHCPGVIAMARNNDKDSSRSDFYIVIGQAPRYLDRNMNVFGRVIDGMDAVQTIERGPRDNNGIFRDDRLITRIRTMRLAVDVPAEQLKSVYVMDTNARAFEELLDDRRYRKQSFFHNRPPEVLDVCQVPVATRTTK